ncbi:MAG: hypothetical protein H3C54_14110 [Taibaiella sp.]|nr:hypothetical protein [Taibaiella sp.]
MANAQPNPKNYFDFKDRKQLVFTDDFDNDNNNWLICEPKGCEIIPDDDTMPKGDSCYIDGGLMRFSVQPKEKIGRVYVNEISIDMNFNRNFEIEFRAHIYGDNDNYNFGTIYWGRPCNSINGNNVYFGHKGLRIFYSNLQFDDSLHPDADESLTIPRSHQKNTYNTYVIRKYDNKYYVFINNEFIGKCPYIPLTGNIIGLGKSTNNSGEFDYIKIYYLPD